MRINLNQLRAFFLAAREKSITKAAGSLYVTQPAVTMQIKSLEQVHSLQKPCYFNHTKRFLMLRRH